jgi:hypothetical protein
VTLDIDPQAENPSLGIHKSSRNPLKNGMPHLAFC